MTTLALAWVADRGAVRFVITGAVAGQTVKRVLPGGALRNIRGYSSDRWWQSAGASAYGYDYEAPLGVTVLYAVVPMAANTLPASAPQDDLFTASPGASNGEAWLRDVLQPTLSIPVSFVSSGDEVRAARQTVLEIAGRRAPYVVWDVRRSRHGTVSLGVRNDLSLGVEVVPTNRQKLETLLVSGRPLLLSVCDRVGFAPVYMAVGDATFTRVGRGALWLAALEYDEVDVPTSEAITIPPEMTYATAAQVPPSALYSDWTVTTYFGVATRRTV